MIEAWAEKYVGLPFAEKGRTRDGLDCWGLVRLVLAEQFDIELPSYADGYENTADRERVNDTAVKIMAEWRAVPIEWAQAGDAVVFVPRCVPLHVGVIVGDGKFLHIQRGINAVIERLDSACWKRRIEGIYRYGQ